MPSTSTSIVAAELDEEVPEYAIPDRSKAKVYMGGPGGPGSGVSVKGEFDGVQASVSPAQPAGVPVPGRTLCKSKSRGPAGLLNVRKPGMTCGPGEGVPTIFVMEPPVTSLKLPEPAGIEVATSFGEVSVPVPAALKNIPPELILIVSKNSISPVTGVAETGAAAKAAQKPRNTAPKAGAIARTRLVIAKPSYSINPHARSESTRHDLKRHVANRGFNLTLQERESARPVIIQSPTLRWAGWTRRSTAARACRALAHNEQESAKKISDPALRVPVSQRAQCAAALAERFERARAAAKLTQ
jgi:hypothetical protein